MSYSITLPHAPQIEAAVLGTCLLSGAQFATVAASLTADAFYNPSNQAVFAAMHKVCGHGHLPDALLTAHALQHTPLPCGSHPAHYMAMLIYAAQGESVQQLSAWCAALQQLAAQRALITITSSGYTGTDVVADATALQQQLTTIATGVGAGAWVSTATTLRQLTAQLDAPPTDAQTISTTLPLADAMNGGLQPGQLIVLGARPGVGKSALMGSIALKAALAGHPSAIISMEMTATDLLARMLSTHTGIPLRSIRQRTANARVLTAGVNTIGAIPLWTYAPPTITMPQLRARAHELHQTRGLKLLLVDYIQLISEQPGTSHRSREQGVSAISRALKSLAMELEIPILALSQLNRAAEARADKRPQLSDLRESGAIEQDADIVMLLHRDWRPGHRTNAYGQSTEHTAHLNIAKWRNGRTLDINLGWDGETLRFWQE